MRMRRIKLGADHLAGAPPMGGSDIEPPHYHGMDPLDQHLQAEIAKWKPVIQAAGVYAD
jgi:hypothetical protein